MSTAWRCAHAGTFPPQPPFSRSPAIRAIGPSSHGNAYCWTTRFREHLDAASAGLRVGYEDASQFSREYKRRFGQPPGTRAAGGRDVERLREAARGEVAGPRA